MTDSWRPAADAVAAQLRTIFGPRLRSVVAYDVSAMMEYKGMRVKEAGQIAIDKVGKLGGQED